MRKPSLNGYEPYVGFQSVNFVLGWELPEFLCGSLNAGDKIMYIF